MAKDQAIVDQNQQTEQAVLYAASGGRTLSDDALANFRQQLGR